DEWCPIAMRSLRPRLAPRTEAAVARMGVRPLRAPRSFRTERGDSRGYRQAVFAEDLFRHVLVEGFGDGKAEVVTLAFLLTVFSRERDEQAELSLDHSYAVDHELIVEDNADEGLQGIVLLLVADGVDVYFSDFDSFNGHLRLLGLFSAGPLTSGPPGSNTIRGVRTAGTVAPPCGKRT